MKNKQVKTALITKTGRDLLQLVRRTEKGAQHRDIDIAIGTTEHTVYDFWISLLGHSNFGVNDDFFKVGGNSIKAIQLLSRISSQFPVQISLTDIFLQPTVAQIATLISKKNNGDAIPSPVIRVRDRHDHIPLSFSQERLWFINQLEGTVPYHIPVVLRLQGRLNRNALFYALKTIVSRHESLRSVIFQQQGNAYQEVMGAENWVLQMVEAPYSEHDRDGIKQCIHQLISMPFDLSKDYMLRSTLIRQNEQDHLLVVILHHIAADGWSMPIMVNEVSEMYRAYVDDRPFKLSALNVQYADYAIWQRNYLNGVMLENKTRYWKEQLREVSPLQLPTDFIRPVIQSTAGATVSFSIDKEMSAKVQRLGHEHGATLFMTLLATFKVLLYRYSGQHDIVVGTAIAGRQDEVVENLIGFFVNTLALRTRIDSGVSFTGLLEQVKNTTLEAYSHQEIPFEKVVQVVVRERDRSRSPLFQVMFVLQHTQQTGNFNISGLDVSEQQWENNTSKFDISFYVTETADGLYGSVEYCTDLYNEQTIMRMIGHYKELLDNAVKTPDQKIELLRMLTLGEEHRLLVEFNSTGAVYDGHQSITGLFEAQVAQTPEAIAVIFEKEQVSYKELNERANQLSGHLKDKGIKEGMLVPVCIERSVGMIVGILAILKSGAAFVPVDPEYPLERIIYILHDVAASVLLTSTQSKKKLQRVEDVELILLDGNGSLVSEQPSSNTDIAVFAHQLAYVIHTSGSTGKPKGVMIEHGAVSNVLKCIAGDVGFTSASAFLSVTTFSFDISYLEFFIPLTTGGRLIIVPREIAMDGYRLTESIGFYNPTHLQATPATWQLLLEAGWQNREGLKMLIGGEAVTEEIRDGLAKMGDLYNLYGPTETTIWSVSKKLAVREKVLIGKPIANTSIYILGAEMQLVPIGVPGEICIAGAGLARGYFNRPELTNEKFISNPFSDLPGAKLYKTGDMGRWMADGNLECMRRIDDQVKIRGYRIELGEIESALMDSGLVQQSVVLSREGRENNNRLIAYYVPKWPVIKAREIGLYESQVVSWKEIYEAEYAQIDERNGEAFEMGIWKDSFTGKTILEKQMREWLQDIVRVILSQKVGHVLEIGCGTGLVYFQLAGKVSKYTGTDFSLASVNYVRDKIAKGLQEYAPAELKVCAAHEVSMRTYEQVDTIILNSVVQYFPGEQYMNEVIANCISLIKGSGRIIIGDVRDNRLLELFSMRLLLQKMAHTVEMKEFKWSVEQAVLKEEELCFRPEYFYRLQSIYSQVSHVEIMWKDVASVNEMSLYRYTVVLHVGSSAGLLTPDWQNWEVLKDKKTLVRQLEAGNDLIAIKDVPNVRLWRERLLSNALIANAAGTVGELLQISERDDPESREINEILHQARVRGYHIRLLLNEDPLRVNVVMELHFSGKGVYYPDVDKGREMVGYTNVPLFTDVSLLLQNELKVMLQERLPEYMIPSELVGISHMPLTNNGKIDRRFLSHREDKFVLNKSNYQTPQTAIEQHLAEIWQELLGIGQVGIYDNFFELGGHSLLAMRVISAIRRKLQLEMPVKTLFVYPTIKDLARNLEDQVNQLSIPEVSAQKRPPYIPLSFGQERLWFIDKLEGSIQYHLTSILRLKGNLNTEAVSRAFNYIVNRHEILRTVILEDQGKSYQSVKENNNWMLHAIDGTGYKNNHEALWKHIHQLINVPFDLSADYMLRAAIIRLDEQEHVLVATMHHIASDGWSTSIIVKELLEIYAAFLEGRRVELEPLPIQYVDYAIWQKNYLQGDVLENKLKYWKDKLNGFTTLQLPTDHLRPAVQSTRGAQIRFNIDRELSEQLSLLSQRQGATLFMTLMAVFKLMLHRYSGQEDICIGTPVANRNSQETENLIGIFINTIAIRSDLSGNPSFNLLLYQIKNNTLEAYAHQDVPFEKVIEAIVSEREMNKNPIFQVLFTMQNNPEAPELRLSGVSIVEERYEPGTSQLDLICDITETTYGLEGLIEYSTDLFDQQTIQRMAAHFKQLLVSAVSSPYLQIGSLSMLSHVEEHQLLVEFNDNKINDPGQQTVVDLFEDQVEKSSESVAVIFEEQEISYAELNAKSNQLAHFLKKKGIKEETLVPIFLERSVEMIIGIWGILKAGGAYVPIELHYPEERISHILEDTAATIIVTTDRGRLTLPLAGKYTIISLDGDWKDIGEQPAGNIDCVRSRKNLAYVIYTSGSTGMPKGSMIEHGSLWHYLLNEKAGYSSAKSNKAGSFIHLSYTFDASLTAMFMPLLFGKSIVMSAKRSLEVFEDDNLWKYAPYDFIKTTPSHLALLQSVIEDEYGRLLTRKIVIGGETLLPRHFADIVEKGHDIEIINEYGPTEATVGSTVYSFQTLSDTEKIKNGIPIGQPLNNTQVYILDAYRQLLPVGVSGEIYLGGDGIARGYLNQEQLTVEKFVTNPFTKEAGSRLYRTGDIGCWLPDGNIKYIGRKDDQVKIRGYRIELGEIEFQLQRNNLVKQAVVLAREDSNGNKRLVAYIVPKEAFDSEEMIAGLTARLPEYMVPSFWVELKTLPLNSNGKVDKKALQDPEMTEPVWDQFVAPRTETEQKLAAIWKELLEVEQVGIHDNFFKLGGHSLLAIRLISIIRKGLKVEVPINDVFEYPSISTLAVFVDSRSNKATVPSIERQPRPAYIPLSFSQERLWFVDKLEGTPQYHLPAVIRLKGNVNTAALANALREITHRHEVIRTVIRDHAGLAYQYVKEHHTWQLNIIDGTSFEKNGVNPGKYISDLVKVPFRLSSDYMMRSHLIQLDEEEYILVFVMHHIASDGWSVSIIVKELIEIYSAYQEDRPSVLTSLPIQYADYAIWQRKYLQGNTLDKKLDYWKEKLIDVPSLQLPTDFTRPTVQSARGSSATFVVHKELREQLKNLGHGYGATLFMTLLAAFKVLLHRYSGQEDVCVGTPVAGRHHKELEGLIGFFVNTLALRTTVNSEDSFTALLGEVKKTTLDAYAHQEVPFEKVVDRLIKDRDMSRSPMFQVMFVLQNTPDTPELKLHNLTLSVENWENDNSKFDISLFITETADGLQGSVEYCTDLFKEQTINRLIGHFKKLLASIVHAPGQKIGLLPMLTTPEKQQLLVDFNNTKSPYTGNQDIIDLFKEQVSKNPDATALVFQNEQLTYENLDRRSDQFAHYLRSKGVGNEMLVPVCIERSIEMIVGILGILKSGAAFVPINPDYPQKRISYILNDTGAFIILSSKSVRSRLPVSASLDIIELEDAVETSDQYQVSALKNTIRGEQLAYIIYTSGSTGEPKGVMIEHRSLLNYLLNNKTQYNAVDEISTGSYLHLSYTFDGSITAMFMPLLYGRSLVIGSRQGEDVFEDSNLLRYAPYDFIKITPAHLDLLRPEFKAFGKNKLTQKLVIGGEALHHSQFASYVENEIDVEIINEYGPTEATVGCTTYGFYTFEEKDNEKNIISIGKPIDNVVIYILSNANHLVPIGVYGEVCVAGAGLARGYLNQPGLTAEKFIDNPFSTIPGDRIYKTGDIGRWLPDGNIEYLGRADEQVKIRGYRIELGEIESILHECILVRQVAVLAKVNNVGSKRLVAYIVPADIFDKEALISYLRTRLPGYMIPAQWIQIESMPLTPNGKINKKLLPEPTISGLVGNRYEAPQNDTEKVLIEIWHQLLQSDLIGIHDNFFELGGDSILTIQVVSRAKVSGLQLEPKDLFNYQTVSKLAAAITDRSIALAAGEQGILTGFSKLLPDQQRYLEKGLTEASRLAGSVLLNTDKNVSSSELNLVLKSLTAHHDALRFNFFRRDNSWQQEYGAFNSKVITEDLQSVPPDLLASKITGKIRFYERSLDISKGELLRVVLVKLPVTEAGNLILIVINSLVIDRISWKILLEDLKLLLTDLKEGKRTVPGIKTSSYRQWQQALENYAHSTRVLSQLSYWQQASVHYHPSTVDQDYSGPVKSDDINSYSVQLNSEQTLRLVREINTVYHTEVNDILLAALVDTIAGWSGKKRATIGLAGHGREHIDELTDVTRTVGCFTSTYPLSLVMPVIDSEADLIKSVKEQLRHLPDNGLGYGVLKYINKEASLQGKEPWDIAFNYVDRLEYSETGSNGLSAFHESLKQGRGKEQVISEKILIDCSFHAGALIVTWNYNSRHYNEVTIKKLSEAYVNNLKKLIAHCIENKGVFAHTPSDYGLGSEITYRELDGFLSEPFKGKQRHDFIDGLYRLSGLQEGMLFHGLYDHGIDAYLEQVSCDLIGADVELLTKSWSHLIKRHSIFRSAFYFNEFRVPVQCVYKEVSLPLVVLDYGQMTPEKQMAAIKEFYKADMNRGIDFKEAPLMRLTIFRLGQENFRMLLTSHHILFDGWSFPVLMEEFLNTYEVLKSGGEVVVGLEDRYEDYIRYIQSVDKGQEEIYWREYLRDVEQNTLLPFIATTTERNKGSGNYQKLQLLLDTGVTLKIQSFAQRHHLTINTIMQGVWSYLLHHYTGMKNIVYGIVVSGRPDDLPGVEQRVGMYINTLVFSSAMKEDRQIVEWLQEIQSQQVNSRQYQHTPLHKVQGWSGVQGDLFDTLLTFENFPVNKILTARQWALNVNNFHIQEQTNYPLNILITSAEQIDITFSYNAMLLQEAYAEEIKNHFEHVLRQLIAKQDSKISDLVLLTPFEQRQVLQGFNDTTGEYRSDHTVIRLFEEQVLSTPLVLAAVCNDDHVTYQELNKRSNQLAHSLRNKGVNKETPVIICLDRSIEMVVGILGILKAGGAYVPVDPDYPPERIRYIIEDTGAHIIVSNKAGSLKLQLWAAINIVDIESDVTTIAYYPSHDLKGTVKGNHLAYIIYTSGSTGKPKGVMIEHKSLLNYLLNNKTRYTGTAENSTGSYIHLSYTFDASLTAIFMPFLSGKAVVIGSKQSVDVFHDPNLLKYAPYDFIKITPSHLELLQPKFNESDNRLLAGKLVIGGEALYPGQFEAFVRDNINVEIINEYGPTEATIGATTYSFFTLADKEKIKNGILIGKPIDNVVIYILDDTKRLVPAGVKGEICIGGAGVARGYLNRTELTEEKFIEDPFSNKAGERIYKTGDIGRWLPDGNIEYLGRMDDQVKIRGYRVELGEVEHSLQECASVSQGVILGKEDKAGGLRLVSYYVPEVKTVKSKESELSYLRVANWKELYETEYAQTQGDENIDPEFNIIGWNDSFTGKPIMAEHMREWLDDIVEVVLSEKPGNVLEIGCGTGLIYYQLAEKIKRYTGSDLSASSINQITERISKGIRNYCDTQLLTAPAHEVSLKKDQEVDTVLLNSIVQYFPGEDYMNTVIEKGMAFIKGKGRLIIGDVRDKRLLELFKGRLRMHKLQNSVGLKEFKWDMEQDILKEEELCFSPDYFYKLKNIYPEITHISIQWKHASYLNELSLYRYTVVIYAGFEKKLLDPEWQSWNDLEDKHTVFSKNGNEHSLVALKDVPNPRLWKERLLQQALHNKSFKTVGDLMHALEKEDQDTIQVNQLISMAVLKGFTQRFLVHEDPLKINILLERNPGNNFIQQPAVETPRNKDWNTNIPLFTDISFLLQKEIREQLHNSLPDYMIPADFFALHHLPMTSNGKVDRAFLKQREDSGHVNTLNYVQPSTIMEKALAEIWQELLQIDRVGKEDNFFEIGGHSLLAMRVIAAIRKKFKVELNIKELFVHPTIGLLAAHIQKVSTGLLLPPIEAVDPRPDLIPLSFSQERIWFIDQLGGSLQYHIPEILRLKGSIDIQALSAAVREIINRHEVLRTSIRMEAGQNYQFIREKDNWQLSIVDGSVYNGDIEGLQYFIRQLIDVPFNLSKDYMLRGTLISCGEQDHILVATLHHIASDGWSTSIMVNELVELYNAFVKQRSASLTPLPVQYADYAIWQRKYMQGEVWDKKLNYWKEKLAGVSVLHLPTDYPRPLVQSIKGTIIDFKLDKGLSDKLQSFSRREGSTLFMTLLTAFKVLLYRYSGQQDICVGTPVAGRQQKEVEDLIGFFVNTLALRSELNDDLSFINLLRQVKETTLDAYDHQEVPFEKVVELVAAQRDLSRSALFQVMLVLQNTPPVRELRLGDLQLAYEATALGYYNSKFDAVFYVTASLEGLLISVGYCSELFKKETIEKMMVHFEALLRSALKDPEQQIGLLPMLSKSEKHQLLVEFNDSFVAYPTPQTIVGLFEEQANNHPDDVAVIFEQQEITYRTLNRRSNQLANYLRSKGVKNETLVPVCFNRSEEMIIALLGILKAGGAYVPVDPGYPEERLAFILEDTAATVVVTDKESSTRLRGNDNIEIVVIDADGPEIDKHSSGNLQTGITPNNLAYVIYTSGSTGKPKGVMIEHKAVLDHCFGLIKSADLTSCKSFAFFAPLVFDAGHAIIHSSFILGSALVVLSKKLLADGKKLTAYINDHSIDCIKIVPSVWLSYADNNNFILAKKVMIFGGESFSINVLDRLAKLTYDGKVYNHYGPTETAIGKTIHQLDLKKQYTNVPIGKPFSNTFLFILNKALQPVSIGVAGELYIAGDGLARGYLNSPLLTAEKFISNQFTGDVSLRMYKTGDLARWLPDGSVEYLARIDEQVKIRGFRIEPGEIENALMESPLVHQAVVLAKETTGNNKMLVAYIVPAGNFEQAAIVGYLTNKLPEYMVPSRWVHVSQIPLTTNGKIDKKALADMEIDSVLNNKYAAPRTMHEKKLAEIWQELLGVEKVGIYDSFFELGGHSLLAMRMVTYIESSLLISIPIKVLFQFTNISDLAKYLETQENGRDEKNKKAFKVYDV